MTPFQYRRQNFKNRIGLAPLTRGRASRDGLVNNLVAQYYTQRASSGFIVSESVAISKRTHGWFRSPGIWSNEQACPINNKQQRVGTHLVIHRSTGNCVICTLQVESWKDVTESVHQAGGKIYCQV